MSCPDDQLLSAGLFGVSANARELVLAHLADCDICRQLAAAMVRHEDSAKQGHRWEPGHRILGRYAIIRFMAKGGMGEVYEARDEWLGERVAIKTILALEPQRMATLQERFRSEVRTARRIRHANVCKVLEAGVVEVSGGDQVPFLTMEFLEGQPLSEFLKQRGPLSQEEVRGIARQVCAGMSEIHAAGILHRDLKPENVMVCPDGGGVLVKIMDFGLAKDVLVTSGAQRTSADIGGTPSFLAPEVFWGEPGSVRSDIYSFGVLLHELSTGKMPRLSDEGSSRTATSGRLLALAKRCMSLNADERPASFKVIDVELASAKPRRSRGVGISIGLAVVILGVASGALLINRSTRDVTPAVRLSSPPVVTPVGPSSNARAPTPALADGPTEVTEPQRSSSPFNKVLERPTKPPKRRRAQVMPSPEAEQPSPASQPPTREPPQRDFVVDPYE